MEIKITKIKEILCLHFIFFIYSLGGIFSKKGGMTEFFSREFLFYYSLVILCLIIYAILWQQILRTMPLSTAFSNKSIVVIWGMIWGALFFREKITMQMVLGAIIVTLGVYMVVTDNE